MKGMRASSVAACAISAKSMTSCTEFEASMANPVGAGGHHVAVIAENRKRVRGQGARGDVKDRRGQLAGDLVHVGDHQQQALRRRERRRQRPGLQGAVHGAGGAAFALHFDTMGTVPQILAFPSADHWSAHSPILDDGVMG